MSSQPENTTVVNTQPQPEAGRLSHNTTEVPVLAGYTFVQGLESEGGELIRVETTDLQKLKEYCDSHSDAVAFNTNGWIKKTLKPQAEWLHISDDPRTGTYVKQIVPAAPLSAVALEGYTFVRGFESPDGDAVNLNTKDLQALKAHCDANPECIGFNTNGLVKKSLRPKHEWIQFSENPLEGTYVKTPLNPLRSASIIVRQEGEVFNRENAFKALDAFINTNQIYVAEEDIQKLNKEIEAQRHSIVLANTAAEERRGLIPVTEGEIAQHTTQQNDIGTARNALVDKILVKDLEGLKFPKDANAVSTEVFRWVYQALYNEPKANYDLKTFTKVALKAGKGKDFPKRLREFSVAGLKNDDISYGKTVVERREEIFTELETKKKQNASLRNLVDYIANVVSAGELRDQINAKQALLTQQKTDLEGQLLAQKTIAESVKTLESNVAALTRHISALTNLKVLTQAPVVVSESPKKVKVHSTNPDAVVEGEKPVVESKPVEVQPVVVEQKQVVQEEKVVKSEVPVAAHVEEETLGGQHVENKEAAKKVESEQPAHPAIELKESQFAGNKGSCESCGIF